MKKIVPREGFWTVKPLRPRAYTYYYLWMIVKSLILLKVFYLLTHGEQRPPTWIYLVQFAGYISLLLFVVGNELYHARLTREDAARSERPEGLEEYPVEVSIWADGSLSGSERGILYFDEGLLGFVGARTSFLLGPQDIRRRKEPVLTRLDESFCKLILAMDKDSGVRFRPLFGHGRNYRKALRRFLDSEPAMSDERQWPPLSAWKAPVIQPMEEETVPVCPRARSRTPSSRKGPSSGDQANE